MEMKKTTLNLFNQLPPIQQKAILALEQIEKSTSEANKLNYMIDRLTGDGKDFYQHNITPILSPIEVKVVDLLDEILDCEIASYYLYECGMMSGGGHIQIEGKDYRITDIDSVVKFVHSTKPL
jgi:L-lysine 2,3-aminomutase